MSGTAAVIHVSLIICIQFELVVFIAHGTDWCSDSANIVSGTPQLSTYIEYEITYKKITYVYHNKVPDSSVVVYGK